MKAFINGLDKFMEILCSTILAAMVLIVLYQVFARKVLNNPNTVTEELVRFGLVWVAMLASAYVVGKKSHLCVTLLSDNLNEKGKLFLEIVVQVLFILFAAVIMIYGGWQASLVTMGQISPSLSIPMGYVYLSVPVSGAIMLLYSVMNLLDRTPRTVESEAE
ncbi:TRAP transporter small permease [Enterococcus avium]|uniref:TRAP transporter small permease n=1 Tax=Enterococcus avium TaxID=33945 RepID=UPI0026FA593D|nr:TRAP transporter small permease [Enterococcus avium]MDO7797537.1 TRAP transporter small permease [Enterococcus avium]MDT2547050.1 TRAP transporter small permease [Enterococcus avium]